MARKLDVALGLVHRPRVLFLDEPTTGLDPEARTEMWAEIARLAADEQVTVLLTTHYLDEADRIADRLAIVDAGQVVVEGTPEELKRELRGDTVQVELDVGRRRDRRVRGAGAGCAGSPTSRPTAARCAPAPTAAAARCPAVLAALDDAGIAVASVTVGRPSLDDVYLRYVGPQLRGGGMTRRRRRLARSTPATSPPARPRRCGASRRSPSATLVQPIIWLLLFGQLFRSVVELPGFGDGSAPTWSSSRRAWS